MTGPNQELDLAATAAVALPSTEHLADFTSRALTNGDIDGIAFQLVFTNGKTEIFTRDNILGKRLYTPHEVENIRERYDAMIQLLNVMVTKGFTVTRLEIATKEGLAGARIKFLTPQNRQFEHQYFHPNIRNDEKNLGSNLIPDDFLYDLKMFPVRHG